MGQPVLSEGQVGGPFLQEVEVNKKERKKKRKRKCITEVKLGSSKMKNKSEVWGNKFDFKTISTQKVHGLWSPS